MVNGTENLKCLKKKYLIQCHLVNATPHTVDPGIFNHRYGSSLRLPAMSGAPEAKNPTF
jgi:hypothetical protein